MSFGPDGKLKNPLDQGGRSLEKEASSSLREAGRAKSSGASNLLKEVIKKLEGVIEDLRKNVKHPVEKTLMFTSKGKILKCLKCFKKCKIKPSQKESQLLRWWLLQTLILNRRIR